ncbi:MAG: metalloregulator ArsR/SmtB family transcription factor [Actinomycetota bacterium]|nr:metalloregulator ArsR/SmtB family transcription factor [Actinomycetota bacterium]
MPSATTGATAAATRARSIAPVLKALSDENRLTILLAVADRRSSVTELTAATGFSQTLVSHHLKSLRDNGLVIATPVGRSNVYSLCCEAIAEPIALLSMLATADDCPS